MKNRWVIELPNGKSVRVTGNRKAVRVRNKLQRKYWAVLYIKDGAII